MSGKVAKIRLTEKQKILLQVIKRSTTCLQRLIQRVTIILLAFEGVLNTTIEELVGLGRKQVGLWRRRWQQSFGALVAAECGAPRLNCDAPRGVVSKFTAEQVTEIVALSCEPPTKSDRPIDKMDPSRADRRSDQTRYR